jgi:transposase-like protein
MFVASTHCHHNHVMKCLRCQSDDYSKNGFHKGKQKYICKRCGRQWLGDRGSRGYPQPVRDLCLKMHRNGLEAKAIGQYTGISYNTIINWVNQANAAARSENTEDESPQNFITSLPHPKNAWPPELPIAVRTNQ